MRNVTVKYRKDIYEKNISFREKLDNSIRNNVHYKNGRKTSVPIGFEPFIGKSAINFDYIYTLISESRKYINNRSTFDSRELIFSNMDGSHSRAIITECRNDFRILQDFLGAVNSFTLNFVRQHTEKWFYEKFEELLQSKILPWSVAHILYPKGR